MTTTFSINSKDNKEFSGYLCQPPSKTGPGLLLIQEIFGVNSHIKDVAELYAQAGFVVLAPDLFWRVEAGVELNYTSSDFAKGLEIANKLDMEQVLSDLNDAIDALKKLPEVTGKVGTVGYCLGGTLAYRLAARNKVDAAVSYYGGSIAQALDEAKNLNTPLLMHFAELDKYIPAESIEKISAALANKSNVTIHHYAGIDHGFNCDQRSTYNRPAAMLAFARSVAFLNKHLG
jgi:carboxymethylenebutenolidase